MSKMDMAHQNDFERQSKAKVLKDAQDMFVCLGFTVIAPLQPSHLLTGSTTMVLHPYTSAPTTSYYNRQC